MLAYVGRRLLLAVPTMLGITIVTFVIIRLAPGDPAQAAGPGYAAERTSPQTYERLRATYGLDRPLVVQYAQWLRRVVTLDFGRSLYDGRRVTERIAERLAPTVSIAAVALVLSVLAAVPIGVTAAKRRGGWFDTLSGVGLYGLFAVPRYVTAIVLIAVVGVSLGCLPFRGMTSDDFAALSVGGKIVDLLAHGALIAACMAYPVLAYQSRLVRGAVLEAAGQSYARTARAKGLSEAQVYRRHALRNALLPLITMLGLLLPSVVSGTVILEVIFSWPGIGRLFYESVLQRDYPVIMGLSVLSAVAVLVGTLLADLAYCVADPRVRYE